MKLIWRGFRIALVILCALVFLISGGFLVKILIGYASADKTYEEINRDFETLSGFDTETESDAKQSEGEDEGDGNGEGNINGKGKNKGKSKHIKC